MNRQGNDNIGNESKISQTNSHSDYDDYLFTVYEKSGSRKHRKRRKVKNFILKSLIVLLAIVVAGVGSFIVIQQIGRNKMLDLTNLDITPPDNISQDVEVNDMGRIINYKDGVYKYNENMTSILFMGIDKSTLENEENIIGKSGQADSLFLMALDTETGRTRIIAISRDSMVDVNVYSAKGKYVGIQNEQICLSYSYGDGKETSCENTLKSVSRMFYGLPINSYFSFDLESIGALNDLVGGIEITAENDIITPFRTINKGETVTLKGKEAEAYVRGRDITKLDSNNDRMTRQINYVQKFAKKAINITKSSITFPFTLYNTAQDYMCTNIGIDKVSFLATNMVSNGASELEIERIEGKIKQGEVYAEFYPDETKLFEQMLRIYYKKIQ